MASLPSARGDGQQGSLFPTPKRKPLRCSTSYQEVNRQAAAIILLEPRRYDGLAQIWAVAIVTGDRRTA